MSNNFCHKIKQFFEAKNQNDKAFKQVQRVVINKLQFNDELKNIPAKNFKLSSTGRNLLLDLELNLQNFSTKKLSYSYPSNKK